MPQGMKQTRLSSSNLQGKCFALRLSANNYRRALQALLEPALAMGRKYRP